VRAGLRFELPKSFDFDIGARANYPPEAFMTLKWGMVNAFGNWRLYPFAKVYADTDDGVGMAAAMTVDRWWGRAFARTSTYMNWDDSADAIEWDQTLSLGYARELLDDRRYAKLARGRDMAKGFGANFSVLGAEISGAMSYRIEMFYKRPLRGRWLYWSGGPLVRWDREYNWNPDYGARLGVDALFWGLVGH
jgi:hypothetical protein